MELVTPVPTAGNERRREGAKGGGRWGEGGPVYIHVEK